MAKQLSFRELQSRAVREATLQDAAVVSYDAELRRVYRRLSLLLRQALEDWDTDADGRTVTSAANLARVFGLRRRARILLRDAGFDAAALAAVGDPLDALAASILKGRVLGDGLGPNLVQVFQAWKDLRLADLLAIGDDVARAIQRIALDGTLGLRNVDRLILDVSEALHVSQRQARTVYDTAVSVFSRQVELSQSTGDLDELFVYVGPVDSRMRPFCELWVGKVRTREAIGKLDNEQLPDVLVSGGGYLCRHQWKRVSVLDDELRAIAGTNDRAPGVSDLLKAVA